MLKPLAITPIIVCIIISSEFIMACTSVCNPSVCGDATVPPRPGRVVGQFEAVVRPKGLGLGASAAAAQQAPATGTDGEQEELAMVPGAFVVVSIGKEKGNYGQVSARRRWKLAPSTDSRRSTLRPPQ